MTRDEETRICGIYEQIACLTATMLESARSAQWERLIELEAECKQLFASLMPLDAGAQPSARYVRRKSLLIRQILADDAEIRKLVEPWVAELGEWLGHSGRSQRLQTAYSAPH